PFGGGGDAWAGVCRPPGRVSRACGPFAQTTGAQQLNTGTGVAIPSRCWDQAEASYQGKRPPWSQVLGPVPGRAGMVPRGLVPDVLPGQGRRSEEHTSELQSRFDLVCRLLLEKKKQNKTN